VEEATSTFVRSSACDLKNPVERGRLKSESSSVQESFRECFSSGPRRDAKEPFPFFCDKGEEPPSQQGGRATEPTRGKSHRDNKGNQPPRPQGGRATEQARGKTHRANKGEEPPSQQGERATGTTRGRSHRADEGKEPPRQQEGRATETTRGKSHRDDNGD
jgi:hypothetical protein